MGKYVGDMRISFTSPWVTESGKPKYFNRVAHIARVNMKVLKKEGFTGYKVRHHHIDTDEFEEDVEVTKYLTDIEYK